MAQLRPFVAGLQPCNIPTQYLLLKFIQDSALGDAAWQRQAGAALSTGQKGLALLACGERFQHPVTIIAASKGIVTQIWTQNPHRNASILA
jgi:hypothetical protein